MKIAATMLLLAVGVLHLLPVFGVLSAQRLESLYGVQLEEPNLIILMRHRAVLFGIVGALLVAAALLPSLRLVGIGVGLVSTLSFVLIAWLVGDANPALRRVVLADVVASAALVGAVVFEYLASGRSAIAG